MEGPEMPDYMVAARLTRIADKYNFELYSCECGKVYEISDVLRDIASLLRKGLVERKGE